MVEPRNNLAIKHYRKKVLLIGFLVFPCLIIIGMDTPNEKTRLIAQWERARDYSLKVTRAMPENMYDFKPKKDLFTFREEWLHVIDNISNFHHTKILEQGPGKKHSHKEKISKAALIKKLEGTFNSVLKTIKSMEPPELDELVQFRKRKLTKKEIIYLMRDHNTHHRSRAILYLSLNDIEAPSYVGW